MLRVHDTQPTLVTGRIGLARQHVLIDAGKPITRVGVVILEGFLRTEEVGRYLRSRSAVSQGIDPSSDFPRACRPSQKLPLVVLHHPAVPLLTGREGQRHVVLCDARRQRLQPARFSSGTGAAAQYIAVECVKPSPGIVSGTANVLWRAQKANQYLLSVVPCCMALGQAASSTAAGVLPRSC